MFFTKFFAAGALISTATAIPFRPVHHEKRDIAWVTQVQEDIVTVAVTTTVWLNPGETPEARVGAPHGHHGHHRHKHHKSQRTHYVHNTVTVHPVPATAAYTSPAETNTEAAATTPTTTSIYTTPTTAPYVAPTTPTTTPHVAPSTPTATPAPAATTSAAAPIQPASSGSGSGTTYTGDITYYAPGLGSCGITSTSTESIVALPEAMMEAADGSNPNDNPYCGKTISISYGGKTTTATVVDTCPGCSGGSIDLSPSVFEQLAPLSEGRVSGVTWQFT